MCFLSVGTEFFDAFVFLWIASSVCLSTLITKIFARNFVKFNIRKFHDNFSNNVHFGPSRTKETDASSHEHLYCISGPTSIVISHFKMAFTCMSLPPTPNSAEAFKVCYQQFSYKTDKQERNIFLIEAIPLFYQYN